MDGPGLEHRCEAKLSGAIQTGPQPSLPSSAETENG